MLLAAAGVGSLTTVSRLAIQRLQIHAQDHCSHLDVRQFATLRQDRLYVPLAAGPLLCASPGGLVVVPNGDNQDSVWVECSATPFDIRSIENLHRVADLAGFERLVVNTQACVNPSMRWFVAMHAALLPFVRDQLLARAILVCRGPSQSGKTSGAQRFTKLLGLGEVKGDYSTAALANLPDCGLLVIDNREQADCTRDFTNYCLYLSTGAERARANPEGKLRVGSSRPIGVITSIEGMIREELRRRCIEVPYCVTGERLHRDAIEREILERRNEMCAGLVQVLVRYLQIRSQHACPNPVPDFHEYFITLCDLLRAYGDVSDKGCIWAESITDDWAATISSGDGDDEDELELAVLEAITRGQIGTAVPDFVWHGDSGTLYVTDVPTLLITLRRLNPTAGLPRSGNGLLRRLKSTRFKHVGVIEGTAIPTIGIPPGIASPPIGLWVRGSQAPTCPELNLGQRLEPPRVPQCLEKIGPAQAREHACLDGDDCYYLWLYETGMPNRGSGASPANALIINLKFSPGCRAREPLRWSRKQASIQHAARALSQTVPAEWRLRGTWVPIPPSRLLNDPGYDPRLIDILRSMTPPPADIRLLLRQTQGVRSLTKGISPAERARMLMVEEQSSKPAPECLIVFDDVIASGAHFKAAQQVLSERFPKVPVVGVFLSRRVLTRKAAVAASCAG